MVQINEQKLNTRNSNSIAVIANDISYMKQDLSDIKGKLEKDYVTRQELDPIKKIVYGLVGLIMTGVVGGLMTLLLSGRH